jgi:hypothetical protein
MNNKPQNITEIGLRTKTESTLRAVGINTVPELLQRKREQLATLLRTNGMLDEVCYQLYCTTGHVFSDDVENTENYEMRLNADLR